MAISTTICALSKSTTKASLLLRSQKRPDQTRRSVRRRGINLRGLKALKHVCVVVVLGIIKRMQESVLRGGHIESVF
jgi:transposase